MCPDFSWQTFDSTLLVFTFVVACVGKSPDCVCKLLSNNPPHFLLFHFVPFLGWWFVFILQITEIGIANSYYTKDWGLEVRLARGQGRPVGRGEFLKCSGGHRLHAPSPSCPGPPCGRRTTSPGSQDSLGALRAARHSQETPVPSSCQGPRSCLRLHILFGNCFK